MGDYGWSMNCITPKGQCFSFSFSVLKPGVSNISWQNPVVTCDPGPAVAGPEITAV